MLTEPWRIELLGGLRLCQSRRTIERFRTQKTAALLAYLAYFAPQNHGRDALVEMFWPEAEVGQGRQSLRQALASLRGQLEPPGTLHGAVLLADRTHVRLNSTAVTVDVAEFLAALGEPTSLPQLRRAETIYRGDLLPGFYEEWIRPERERLAEAYRYLLTRLSEASQACGDLSAALDYALRAVAADPLHEEANLRVMRLYADTGRLTDALAQYEQLKRTLREQMGTVPSDAAQSLAASLRNAPPISPAAGHSYAVGAQPSQPGERPYIREEPGPRSAGSQGDSSPTIYLPLPLTAFFGREAEIARLLRLMVPCRLLTLTGPGGSGKTRLAVEAARRMTDRFPGGVWFVSLADLSEARSIPAAIRDGLRLPPGGHEDPLEQVVMFLNGRAVQGASLLLLDNFEHLADEGTTTVWTLLERVPTLKLLLTSRQRLRLDGEHVFAVSLLPTPEAGPRTPVALLECASVQLLADRMRARRPDFQVTPRNAATVAALCKRLEGVPLSIELAAGWSYLLTPAQMLARLEEQRGNVVASPRQQFPVRHQSLWAALEASFRLLPPEQQRFLARLSVFRGGWTVEAAETICEEPLALDYLAQLRERSIVQTEEDESEIRFRMLETIREYAQENLQASGETDVLGRKHRDYFLPRMERYGSEVYSGELSAALKWLDREYDNVRSALDWCSAQPGEDLCGLRFATALTHYWYLRGNRREGYARLVAALERCPHRTAERAEALASAAGFAVSQGDRTAARDALEEAVAICRERQDTGKLAYLLLRLGILAKTQGDYPASRAFYEASLAQYRELGGWDRAAVLLENLGDLEAWYGHYTEAELWYQESLTLRRQHDDREGLARPLIGLGTAASLQGDHAHARMLIEEALAILREVGERHKIAQLLQTLGEILRRQGDLDAARGCFEESLVIAREWEDRTTMAFAVNGLGTLARLQGDYRTARRWYAEFLTVQIELEDPYHIRCGVEAFAMLAASERQWEKAARLYGAAEAMAKHDGVLPYRERRDEMGAELARLRAGLSAERLEAAWQSGGAMMREQSIDYALDDGQA